MEIIKFDVKKMQLDNQLKSIKSTIEDLMSDEINHAGYDNIIDALARLHIELSEYFGENKWKK